MLEINLKELKPGSEYQKNVLYKITDIETVIFKEVHNSTSEIVELDFQLQDAQYGIYGKEYRSPSVCKNGCKTADVLVCIVDEKEKKINSLIFDVKSNISAFSDDLMRDNAMLTAIKEVRDFISQIHDSLLHKRSFMIYYQDDEYVEKEEIGIVTKSFESEKFLRVAEKLEKIYKSETDKIPDLVTYKLKTTLKPYLGEVSCLRKFADKEVEISGKIYKLNVFLLNNNTASEYIAKIQIKCA